MKNIWNSVPLGEILTLVSRSETVEPQKTYNILGAHWYARGLYTKDVKSGTEIRANTVYRVEKGDFVYNRLFAWKGSFAVATVENHNCYVSNEFPCFNIHKERVDSRYLWKYFSRASAWNEVLGLSSGGTPTSRNRLKERKFLAIQIPLPPLEEQRRIVARIEVAAKVEEARGLRREAAKETSELLSSTLEFLFPKDIKKWNIQKLNKIASVIAGQHIKAEDYNSSGDGIAYLTGPADFGVKTPEVKRWSFIVKSVALPSDVLLTVKGAGVGKINFAPNIKVTIGRQLMAVRPKTEYLLQEFLYFFLKHNFQYFQSIATATTVPGIRKTDVEELQVPVPSLSEQRSIVQYLDNLQSKVEAVKKLQAETQAELDALMPSILDKAFKGEL
jgi:type I restriction enzyme S subunit